MNRDELVQVGGAVQAIVEAKGNYTAEVGRAVKTLVDILVPYILDVITAAREGTINGR